MSTALARAEHPAAIEPLSRLSFSADQEKMIRDMHAPGANDLEFSVLLETAKALGLNPLKKQIHFVNRYDNQKERNVWSCQTGIDGFRSIADDTGKYDGQDQPEFEYDEDRNLLLARVRVYRKDIGRAFVGEARWDEFVQTKRDGNPTHMWRKMSHTMLAKCAEAQALRKAFPQKLGGLYSDDEMMQAENDRSAAPPAPAQKPQTTRARCDGNHAGAQCADRECWLRPATAAVAIQDAEFEPAKPTPKPAIAATPAIDPAEMALADDMVRRASTAEAKDLVDLIEEAKRLPARVRGRGVLAVVARRFALTTDIGALNEVAEWGLLHGVKADWLAARGAKREAELRADIAKAVEVDAGAA